MPITIYKTVKKTKVADKKINTLAQELLKRERKSKADLSISFVGDARMRSLNYLFRGKEDTTDVLAFATCDSKKSVEEEKMDLGDVFISIPQVRRQAKEFAVSFEEELLRMVTHGILHLLGYDHDKSGRAKKMFAIQEEVLKKYL